MPLNFQLKINVNVKITTSEDAFKLISKVPNPTTLDYAEEKLPISQIACILF